MNKKILRTIIVGIFLVSILMLMFTFGNKISPNNKGSAYEIEKLVKAVIISLISAVIVKLVFLILIKPIEEKRKTIIPNIIKDIIGFFIFSIAAIIIVTQIYDQSAYVIVTFLISTGAIMAYAGSDFLKELIAGIVLDIQNDFRIGDWVKFSNGTIARIIKMKMTGVDLALADGSQLYVSNTALTNEPMINLNQPDKPFFNNIKVVLEHGIPIDRARRILYAAAVNTKGVYDNIVKAVAEAVQENGIVFGVYYKVPNQDSWLELRHQIISSVTKHLHRHNLKVCEITGNLQLQNLDANFVKTFDDSHTASALETLKLSGLLKGCSNTLQKHFATRMEKRTFAMNETIVKQGDRGETMFIIAEGVVDVYLTVKIIQKNGEEKISRNNVAYLTDGEYFGEMALLCGEDRNANVVAKSEVVAYEIRRETIKVFLNEYPDFAKKLSIAIVERDLENISVTSDAIEKLNEKEKTISEFMKAFKSFLSDD